MSLQRQSAVLVDSSTGALCTKEGFKLIAATSPSNDPVITFADGTTQITAPSNARAADFTWSVAAPTPFQQVLATAGYSYDATVGSIPNGTQPVCIGGNIYQLEMSVVLGGVGQSYVNNEAITQVLFAELENQAGSFVEPAPTIIIGPATVTRSLQDAQANGAGDGTLTISVNATVDLSGPSYTSDYIYDKLTIKASAFSNINTSTSTVQVEIDSCKWWTVDRS